MAGVLIPVGVFPGVSYLITGTWMKYCLVLYSHHSLPLTRLWHSPMLGFSDVTCGTQPVVCRSAFRILCSIFCSTVPSNMATWNWLSPTIPISFIVLPFLNSQVQSYSAPCRLPGLVPCCTIQSVTQDTMPKHVRLNLCLWPSQWYVSQKHIYQSRKWAYSCPSLNLSYLWMKKRRQNSASQNTTGGRCRL